MKNLLMGFLMNRDKNTESMRPTIMSTLARAIFFPDGETLLEKWEKNIGKSVAVVPSIEYLVDETTDSSFKWTCTTIGEDRFMLSGRFRPSIANEPTVIENENGSGGTFTITKTDSEGNVTQEEIPYGTGSSTEQYKFEIMLPSDFIGDNYVNFSEAAVMVTEGSSSHFQVMHTFHNLYTEFTDEGKLYVYVNHYQGLDAVDMSTLTFVTGDFSILIDGSFV